MLMIETCDDGVFCGALRDVRYLISKAYATNIHHWKLGSFTLVRCSFVLLVT